LAEFDLERQTDHPFGNSTIISEKAKKRRIGKRKLKGLKFGEHTIAVRNVQ